MQRLLAAGLFLTVLLGACGNDEDQRDTAPTVSPASTTTTETESSATTQPGTDQLPGARVEIFPYEGARLAVVGVAAGDRLNVRSGPGVEFDVVFDLAPLATTATALGHNRSLGEAGFWSEITAEGKTGWANAAYLLQPGEVKDITAELFPTPGDRPRAKSMLELARTVAGPRGSVEPPSRLVVVDGPTVGDLAEITLDVLGLGDDAQGGERLKIFAEPASGGQGFTLRTVEATALCSRGVTGARLCV